MALADRLGLSLDLYQPFRDAEGVTEDEFERVLRRARAKFVLMQRLGIDTMLVCSNVGTATIDDDAVSAEPAATAWGRRLPITAYGSPSRRWPGGATSTTTAGPGASSSSPTTTPSGSASTASTSCPVATTRPRSRRSRADKVFFLQLADAPALSMDVLSWSRHHRLFPGEGAFDLGVVPRARPADGVRRTAVPRGVQRRLPADRGRADRAPGAPVPHLARGPGRQPGRCRRSPNRPASTSSRCGRRTPAMSTCSSASSASPSAADTGARTPGCGPTGRRGSSATSSTPVTGHRRSPPSGSRWLTRPSRPPAPAPSRRRPSTAGPSPPSRSSRRSERPTARRCSSARAAGQRGTWMPEFEGGRDAGLGSR